MARNAINLLIFAQIVRNGLNQQTRIGHNVRCLWKWSNKFTKSTSSRSIGCAHRRGRMYGTDAVAEGRQQSGGIDRNSHQGWWKKACPIFWPLFPSLLSQRSFPSLDACNAIWSNPWTPSSMGHCLRKFDHTPGVQPASSLSSQLFFHCFNFSPPHQMCQCVFSCFFLIF